MRRFIFTIAGIALIAASCTNMEIESVKSDAKVFKASFETEDPGFGDDETKLTGTISEGKHSFTWEKGDEITVFAYAAPEVGKIKDTYEYTIADSVRRSDFKVESVTDGKAVLSGEFKDWKECMKNAYAIYPSESYTCYLHTSTDKTTKKDTTTGKLTFRTINVLQVQDGGANYTKYCHFINYGGEITSDDDGKLKIEFYYYKKGVKTVRNFALTETVLRFKFNGDDTFEKIKISLDSTGTLTTTTGLVGQMNVASNGTGINGTLGKGGYYSMELRSGTSPYTSSSDIYAVIRRLDPKDKAKIKLHFEFFTNEDDTTPAAKKVYTQGTSAKLAAGKVYNLGTIPLAS